MKLVNFISFCLVANFSVQAQETKLCEECVKICVKEAQCENNDKNCINGCVDECITDEKCPPKESKPPTEKKPKNKCKVCTTKCIKKSIENGKCTEDDEDCKKFCASNWKTCAKKCKPKKKKDKCVACKKQCECTDEDEKCKEDCAKTCAKWCKPWGIICRLEVKDLNFANLDSVFDCKTDKIYDLVKASMENKGCKADTNDVEKTFKFLGRTKNYITATHKLLSTCESEQRCTTEFTVNGCDFIAVKEVLTIETETCPHNADKELQIITGAESLDKAKKILADKCHTVLGQIEESKFTDIDHQFTDPFMREYIAGNGFLNERTSNFRGQVLPGSDQESIDVGDSIFEFHKGGVRTTKLVDGDWGPDTFGACENQAYLCCAGRDRQSSDNHGFCAIGDCEDADPADNSNLCYTEPKLTAYPGGIEGNIHCQGLAWADDDTDLISNFKVNNFFYVSMFNQLYQSGYVGSAVPEDLNNVPMCGCVEHMPKVTRADCIQVDVELEVEFSRGADGVLTLQADSEPKVTSKACEGTRVGTNFPTNNDLASYVNKLNEEGRMDDPIMKAVFETLLGYDSSGDKDNEDVCVQGYNKVATDKDREHPCIYLESDDTFLDCDVDSVIEFITDKMDGQCEHGLEKELQILTGTSTHAEATDYISEMCTSTWDTVWASYDGTTFEDIHDDFNDTFMKDYIKGETYLNENTGNFQGNVLQSDTESLEAGEAIDKFYAADEQGAKSSILSATFGSEKTDFEECELNSIMCCSGRDRQFGDNHGNCARNDCVDADPGGNSNLCYTKPSFIPFPRETEGDVHCHGFAWADDTNHPSNVLKYNNFFYASLFDRMYTRGYVQTMTYDKETGTDVVPMCGCIEDMWPVSRASCSEIEFELKFKLIIGQDGTIEASPVDLDDTAIDISTCRGSNPQNGDDFNNDLGSYVNSLEHKGKITEDKKNSIYEVLVGHSNPEQNSNEGSCRESYENETGLNYY